MKTLIFGAGASIPFFFPVLNTSYLTDMICKQKEWDRVMDKYKSYQGKNHLMIPSTTVLQVINAIRHIQPHANFEQIAEIIDKISSYGFDKIPTHNMMNLLIYVMNTGFKPNNINPFASEWSDIPFLLREIIAEAILELQNHHKTTDFKQLIDLQHEFIETVSSIDEEISVMSLNYDDCVYDSLEGLEFEEGFSPVDQHYLRQIDVNKFMHAKKVIYFPHGHLKFQFTDNDNVTFWYDSNLANEERWIGINGTTLGSTLTVLPDKFAYNYNTFLSTGQTKDDGLNHLPYAIYYQRLAVDLFKSDTVYVIGYSFGDNHVNRLLRSFLQLNTQNKIIIVDYYPNTVTMVDEYLDRNNIITKINQNFGTEWQIMYNQSSGKKPANPIEIEKLNAHGYGNLFPQIVFYKKGYGNFLSEFKDIII